MKITEKEWTEMAVNHRWMSATEYARQTGLGVEKVKQFIRDGKIEGEQTEEGYWKVKVYNDECVSKEVFEEEHKKRLEAEITLKNIKNILMEVIIWG